MVVDPEKRIVVSIPLARIWDQDGDLSAERIRDLGVDDIKSMLQQGSVQFVIAKVGSPLDWIHPDRSFDFWRRVAKERIVSPDTHEFTLDDFPDGYCYCAALWRTPDVGDIIVLETHH
ncbi:MAG: hypothetical protein U0795_11855 [Pirellulales bacterium]